MEMTIAAWRNLDALDGVMRPQPLRSDVHATSNHRYVGTAPAVAARCTKDFCTAVQACDRTAAKCSTLAPGRALRVDVERVDRMARRHEQAVALRPPET